MKPQTLQIHPLCSLFPRLEGDEFEALKSDIRTHGLRQPLVLLDGKVLDGGNRARACEELGIEPTTVDYHGTYDARSLLAYVMSANMHRRHLSVGQQATIVALAQDWAKAQAQGRPNKGATVASLENSATVAPFATVADRMEQSGASARTQKMADKVVREAPELAEKVASGEMPLEKAVESIAPAKPKPTAAAREQTEIEKLKARIAELEQENEELRIHVERAEEAAEKAAAVADSLKAIANGEEAKRMAELQQKLMIATSQRDALQVERNEMARQLRLAQRPTKTKPSQKLAA